MASRSIFPKHLPFLIRTPKVSSCESFSHPSLACFSTHIVGDSPILVRDFIRSALYDPNHGYFSQRSGSVGVLERSIKFNQLQGRKAYMQHLHSIYKQNDISWFTPVELFKPWYAHGIAEAIMRTANLSVPLKIYEIGGGSGTCAKGIMDYIMLNAPTRVYNNMTYISVEISSSLTKKQLETVGQVQSHLSKFRVECRDAADKNGWGNVDQQPCWVIMLEVLDNLPHDLIYSENQVLPWMEVWVEKQHDRSELAELYKPLQDPLIISCMEILDLDKDLTTRGGRTTSTARNIWAKIFPKPRRCWLPTGCLKLLEVLHGALPKMSLIASDFSFLPDVKVPGERAPLVSTKKDGSSSDFNSYLNAKGDADIFFPTDFWLLERIDHYCSGWLKLQKDKSSNKGKKRRTIMLDTSSFMEEFGLPSKTRTKDGYNPLLDDFKNTKIYLSVPTHNTK
ncbi:hypothetical protein CsSME_00034008 [Camellia sinensis var. sinensis]|uniref:protein arginine methyltransferase NDUFAF7 homolog, mitochondrial isoform X1 n=2 Tax=Camellia sinensis TaxID=4442 RepID=UPI00103683F5|nr:protein arginine methyltransferase NDUFAF7 homolog, mitochondrial isoform X1 [Camellia sinensis]